MRHGTLTFGIDSRNSYLTSIATCLACVINGETLTGALAQETWLVVAVIILVSVQAVDRLSVERSASTGRPMSAS
jgi:hypothetical protein